MHYSGFPNSNSAASIICDLALKNQHLIHRSLNLGLYRITMLKSKSAVNQSSYVTKVMHLRFLAPDIIESIIDGTHPADWTVEKLFAIESTNWPEQRKALGLN